MGVFRWNGTSSREKDGTGGGGIGGKGGKHGREGHQAWEGGRVDTVWEERL